MKLLLVFSNTFRLGIIGLCWIVAFSFTICGFRIFFWGSKIIKYIFWFNFPTFHNVTAAVLRRFPHAARWVDTAMSWIESKIQLQLVGFYWKCFFVCFFSSFSNAICGSFKVPTWIQSEYFNYSNRNSLLQLIASLSLFH